MVFLPLKDVLERVRGIEDVEEVVGALDFGQQNEVRNTQESILNNRTLCKTFGIDYSNPGEKGYVLLKKVSYVLVESHVQFSDICH
ncbi:MAG: hypothetical protein U9Q06_01695 [Nanoarchaeota archaeon]|nr:hypothetical protein [Nanoarchaeota archaeon]